MKIIIRNVKKNDFNEVLKIYNYYILNSLANFEDKKLTPIKFYKMINNILLKKLPFLVSEIDGNIVGLAYLSEYRNKSGYKYTYEDSIYVHPNYTGIGIGNNLLKKLIKISKKNKNIKNLIAIIGDSKNISSINIHKKHGFKYIGILKKIGFKNYKWVDSVIMHKIL